MEARENEELGCTLETFDCDEWGDSGSHYKGEKWVGFGIEGLQTDCEAPQSSDDLIPNHQDLVVKAKEGTPAWKLRAWLLPGEGWVCCLPDEPVAWDSTLLPCEAEPAERAVSSMHLSELRGARWAAGILGGFPDPQDGSTWADAFKLYLSRKSVKQMN